jgi:uncharacterized membrane protein
LCGGLKNIWPSHPFECRSIDAPRLENSANGHRRCPALPCPPPRALCTRDGRYYRTYSLINGIGVRRSGNPIGYAAMFFVREGITIVICGLVMRGRALCDDIDLGPRGVMGSGALAFASYAIALWASTKMPIAAVATLRESSVLFAAALAVLMLGERLYPARVFGAVLVFGGLAIAKSG